MFIERVKQIPFIQKIQSLRLSNLMLVVILPIIVLVTFTGFGIIFFIGRSYVEDQVLENIRTVTDTSIQSLDQYIDDRIKESKLTSSIIGHIVNLNAPDMGRLNIILDDSIHEHESEYENNMIINNTGIIIASGKNKQKTKNINFNKLPMFKNNFYKSIQGEVWISDVARSPVTGYPVVLITTPIYNNGNIAGVYGIAINFKVWTSKYLSKIKIGQKGYPFLTTDKGVIIYHPDETHVLKNRKNLEIVKIMITKKHGYHRYYYKNSSKIATFATSPRLQWTLGVSFNEEDINEDVIQFGIKAFVITLLLISVVFVSILYISRKVSHNLDKLKNELKNFALGEADLTKKIQMNDTHEFQIISEWFNKFVKSLGMVIKSVKDTSDYIERTMSEFEQVVVSTTTALHNQFSAVEETSTSLEEITEMSHSIHDRASTILGLSNELKVGVETNYSNLHEVMSRLSNIQELTQKNRNVVRQLDQETSQITDIMKTIYDVTNQTKIIAFNAALEVSSGTSSDEIIKRFNVIVSEIRRLAENVSESADEISGKLVTIQDTTDVMVESIEDTTLDIAEINEFMEVASVAFEKLRVSGNKMSSEITDIHVSIENEDKSINQILDAIMDIRKVNAELVSMQNSLKEQFNNLVARFRNLDSYVRSFKV